MAKIDIRNTGEEEITEIIISDDYVINSLKKEAYYNNCPCLFQNSEDVYMEIETEEHAVNIILAIKKAIELGWFKE